MEQLYCQIASLAYVEPSSHEDESLKGIFKDIGGVKKVFFFDSSVRNKQSDAQIYTLIFDDKIIFACRGTESLSDIFTDLLCIKETFQDLTYCNQVDTNKYTNIKVHRGFLNQYNTIKYTIMATLFNESWKQTEVAKKIIFVGHSLGGALSTLGAACAKAHFGDKFHVQCYTFGSPRVGNAAFANYFDDNVDISVRYVNGCDIVARIPRIFYEHVKGEKQIGIIPNWIYNKIGKIQDHFIDKYINELTAIKIMKIDAVKLNLTGI